MSTATQSHRQIGSVERWCSGVMNWRIGTYRASVNCSRAAETVGVRSDDELLSAWELSQCGRRGATSGCSATLLAEQWAALVTHGFQNNQVV